MKKKSRILVSALAGISFMGTAHAAVVAEWNFDDQSLSNSGASAGEHDGATVGDPVFTTDTPTGSGYALDLSAASEYMTVAGTSANAAGYVDTFDALNDFSVSMWVKSPSGSWDSWDELASKGSEANLLGWALRAKNFTDAEKGGLRATFYGGGGQAWDTAPSANLADQLWHLVTFTYAAPEGETAGEIALYIDGELMDAGAATNTAAETSALIFDTREGDNSREANFIYDSIELHDVALTATEVADRYVEQVDFSVDTDSISFNLVSSATTASGSFGLSFLSSSADTEINAEVSISDESHPNALSALTSTPLSLTEQSTVSTVEFEFDNDVANLAAGDSATGLITVAWNTVGETEIHEVVVPYTAQVITPITYDEVILENDFGTDSDIGPGFIERQAGTTGGYTDIEAGVVTTGKKMNSLYGLESSPGLDVTAVSGATAITVEWVVSTSTANPSYNGFQFHMQDLGGSGAIGICIVSPAKGDMQFLETASGTVTATPLGASAPSATSMEDGFTVSLTLKNDNTWEASSMGLSSDFIANGTLESMTYEGIATNLSASSFYQGYTQSYTLDHVTVGVFMDMAQPELTVSGCTMAWKNTTTRMYEVQYKDSLNLGGWTTCTNIAGTPPTTSFELPVNENDTRFFRVVLPEN